MNPRYGRIEGITELRRQAPLLSRALIVAAAIATSLLVVAAQEAGAAAVADLTTYRADSPFAVTSGGDGRMWVSQRNGYIARIDGNGKRRRFRVPTRRPWSPAIQALVRGPDGAVWFAEEDQSGTGQVRCLIGRITSAGHIRRWSLARRFCDAGYFALQTGLVAGPDGNVWFGGNGKQPQLGRITPQGKITVFEVPRRSGPSGWGVAGLTVGADGNLWVLVDDRDFETHDWLYRATPGGDFTAYEIPLEAGFNVEELVAAPDGSLWFGADVDEERAAPDEYRIVRRTPDGQYLSYDLPEPLERPGGGLTLGPDGYIWTSGQIYSLKWRGFLFRGFLRINPANGTMTRYSARLPHQRTDAGVVRLASGPRQRIWFTYWSDNRPLVGRFTTPASTAGRLATPTATTSIYARSPFLATTWPSSASPGT